MSARHSPQEPSRHDAPPARISRALSPVGALRRAIVPPAYRGWPLGEYLRHRVEILGVRARVKWCGIWNGHDWAHALPGEDRCARCRGRHLHGEIDGCLDRHAGEGWTPTPAEQAVLDRQWVVWNEICGHVSTLGGREQAQAVLAHLSGMGWRIRLGATALDAELVARGTRCERCS